MFTRREFLGAVASAALVPPIRGIAQVRAIETDMLPEGYHQFSKVISYVEERYRASLEVSELARIACLSESQFRKRFVKLFKIAPSKFINRIRVQTAAKSV